MQVFYEAGFKDVAVEKTDKSTYVFKSRTGSLDHVLALDSSGSNGSGARSESESRAQADLPSSAFDAITGADVWNINSVEALALEYSRFNYNAGDFYAPDQFRASDHDPVVVGLFAPEAEDGSDDAAASADVEGGVDGGEAEASADGADSDASVSAESDSSNDADSSNADAASDGGSSDSSSGSNGSSTADAGGDLPRTGADPTLMMSIAAGLIVIGASIVLIARRRKLGGRG